MNDEGFHWSEYIIFAAMLVAFIAIIFYFSRIRSSQLPENNADTGKTMNVTAITLSLIASSVSCIALTMGNEIYQYGITMAIEIFGIAVAWYLNRLMLQVLYKLKLVSVNDYLVLRFDEKVKYAASFYFHLSLIVITTLIAYTLSLFLSQLTGIDTFYCFLAIILPCFVLTAMGGFEGVVWTDALQSIAMISSVVILSWIGTNEAGGLSNIMTSAFEGGRLDVEWNIDPTQRLNIMSALLGSVLSLVFSFSVTIPTSYQRFIAVSSERLALRASAFHLLGASVFKISAYFMGLVMYATYQGCDPVLSKRAQSYDQITAYFIRSVGKKTKIIRGIYIVGFMSAGVSSLTTLINTFPLLVYKDFLQKFLNPTNDKSKARRLKRVIFILLAISVTAITLPFGASGTVVELFNFAIAGTTVHYASFATGIFLPWVDSKSMAWGGGIGLIASFVIMIGSRISFARKLIHHPMKQMRIDECPFNVSNSYLNSFNKTSLIQDAPYLFRITPFYHSTMTFLIVVLAALILTSIRRSNNCRRVDKKLISPLLHRYLINEEGDCSLPLK